MRIGNKGYFMSFHSVRTSILFSMTRWKRVAKMENQEGPQTFRFFCPRSLIQQGSYLALLFRSSENLMKLGCLCRHVSFFGWVLYSPDNNFYKMHLKQPRYFKSCVWYNIAINDPTQLLELPELEVACICQGSVCNTEKRPHPAVGNLVLCLAKGHCCWFSLWGALSEMTVGTVQESHRLCCQVS